MGKPTFHLVKAEMPSELAALPEGTVIGWYELAAGAAINAAYDSACCFRLVSVAEAIYEESYTESVIVILRPDHPLAASVDKIIKPLRNACRRKWESDLSPDGWTTKVPV